LGTTFLNQRSGIRIREDLGLVFPKLPKGAFFLGLYFLKPSSP